MDNQYFSGIQEGMPVEIEKIAQLFEYQVFELCVGEDFLIPYMMNDAVEDYLILHECRMTGTYLTHDELERQGDAEAHDELVTRASIMREGDRYVLSVRQGDENAFTLSFANVEERVQCYKYHEIGHFWVRGQEHWRQLVYIIGTIYEKYDHLGEEYCNETEQWLKNLVEFPPFRAWSPIHESLEEMYPSTYEGVDCMEELSVEAKDFTYLWLVKLYRKMPCRFLERLLTKQLLSPRRQKLYERIWQMVVQASAGYPNRDYGAVHNEQIKAHREAIQKKMEADGFAGNYPDFHKKCMWVTATEEHPFTVSSMEFENFVFRVHLMVSKCGKRVKIGRNCGFFRGVGRSGTIEREE